jgi:predicted glycosyltransferase
VKVWLDIDNPPQTRYILPLAHCFERKGCETLITARASESTLAILESEGATFHQIGSSFGKGSFRKVRGVVGRTRKLTSFVTGRDENVDLVIAGSRSATLAAKRLGVPSFAIVDYEHVNLLIYQLAGSYVVYPDVIGGATLAARGLHQKRLMPFYGLKEDFTFAEVDLAKVAPYRFPERNGSSVRVLVRPPAEESHYYRPETLELTIALLGHLAERDVEVIFVPRYERQVGYLGEIRTWVKNPIVLEKPVPFVALLKAVDVVVSGGGTMLREAAFLGIPAYSVFRSRIGAVDRYLASIGRLGLMTSPSDFSDLHLRRRASITPLRQDPRIIDQVTEMILERADTDTSVNVMPSIRALGRRRTS